MVYAYRNHQRCHDDTHYPAYCEKRHQREYLVLWHMLPVHLYRQHRIWMQYALELVAHHLQHHHNPYALEASAGASRTRADKHAESEYHPCEVMPLSGVVVEQSCGGYERHHLEQGGSEGRFEVVAVLCGEQIHYPHGGNDDDAYKELEL